MKQVTIVGLGLIGASLGLALKQLKNPPRVIGNDVQFDAATHASKLKAVDKVERNLAEAVADAEIVVIATPLSSIPTVLKAIADHLPQGCVVTDTGSTKRQVVRLAQEILPTSTSFVGGHPMTGKATSGVEEPDASLFIDTVYCLTPTASTPESAVGKVASMVQEVGSFAYFLDPSEHDGLVAGISHLPYLISSSLMQVLATERSWREMSELAAGGFEITTRLAGRDPKMYDDIMAANADNVGRYLDRLIADLSAVRAQLQSGQPKLLPELEAAQKARLAWEAQRRQAHEQAR